MQIKDIKIPEKGYIELLWKDIEGNAFDDGREYCCISYDKNWCAKGVVLNYKEDLNNDNPTIRITNIFKRAYNKQ